MPTLVLMPDLLQIDTARQENVLHHGIQYSAREGPESCWQRIARARRSNAALNIPQDIRQLLE
jgi:hypothetical protein